MENNRRNPNPFRGELSEEKLLEALKSGIRTDENKALKQMYRNHYPSIEAYVLQNSGNEEQAKDVFQDGLVILFRHVVEGKFKAKSTLKTYHYSICRFLWLKRLRKEQKNEPLSENFDQVFSDDPLVRFAQTEERSWVSEIWKKISDSCIEVLKMSIFYQYSMKEIAIEMEFQNSQVARNKKAKCLQALRKALDGQPMLKEKLKSYLEDLA